MRAPLHDTVLRVCECASPRVCKRSVRRLLECVCLWVKGAELGERGRPSALVFSAGHMECVFCSLRLVFGSDKEEQCVPGSWRRLAQTHPGS